MAAADLSPVLGVVRKVPGVHHPVLIADQAVGADPRRVKVQLQFDVPGHLHEGAAGLGRQGPPGLEDRVQVVVVAVAVVRQGLQLVVLVVAVAHAQHREPGAAELLFHHQAGQVAFAGHPDVKVPVRRHDDPVDPAGHRVSFRQLVGRFDPGGAVGAAARLQGLDGAADPHLVRRGHAGKNHLVPGGVGHQGHPVLGRKHVQ